jgi:AraC-like DNA-binding protein
LLSSVLATIRLSGALQFSFVPIGPWESDTTEPLAQLAAMRPGIIPFHIVVEGDCWLAFDGETRKVEPGDVLVFPFADGHRLGSGDNGRIVSPMAELPAQPWRELPMLRYGEGTGADRSRLLCGFLQIGAMRFAPLARTMPRLLHIRTHGANDGDWIRAMIHKMVDEIDSPRAGSLAMLARLTELVFVELLRLWIMAAEPGTSGWLAALADPALGRCLALIHEDPARCASVQDLATVAGLSRSVLAERFRAMLGMSPMHYVRDWRLYLASVELDATDRSISAIAHAAGYGAEASFNRAFARTYGLPPAA